MVKGGEFGVYVRRKPKRNTLTKIKRRVWKEYVKTDLHTKYPQLFFDNPLAPVGTRKQ